MQFLAFVLLYPFIWLFSRLPMRVLYMLSDVFFFLVYYVFKYRKKVVLENLKLSFPEKNKEERIVISKKFFRHLIDLFMEIMKSFSISKKELSKRYTYKNPELINALTKDGKSVALMGAHQANWEWSFGLPLVLDVDIYASYSKLSNPFFEQKIRSSREKYGGFGLKTSETVKGMIKNTLEKKQGLYILLSDQSPQPHKALYWRPFLGIKVPVHTGAEMLSKKLDLNVVYYVTRKIKRGYYETEFELITDSPKKFDNYQITDKYLELTEKNIRLQPEYYLWSHKRFKHRDKVPKEFL